MAPWLGLLLIRGQGAVGRAGRDRRVQEQFQTWQCDVVMVVALCILLACVVQEVKKVLKPGRGGVGVLTLKPGPAYAVHNS